MLLVYILIKYEMAIGLALLSIFIILEKCPCNPGFQIISILKMLNQFYKAPSAHFFWLRLVSFDPLICHIRLLILNSPNIV